MRPTEPHVSVPHRGILSSPLRTKADGTIFDYFVEISKEAKLNARYAGNDSGAEEIVS